MNFNYYIPVFYEYKGTFYGIILIKNEYPDLIPLKTYNKLNLPNKPVFECRSKDFVITKRNLLAKFRNYYNDDYDELEKEDESNIKQHSLKIGDKKINPSRSLVLNEQQLTDFRSGKLRLSKLPNLNSGAKLNYTRHFNLIHSALEKDNIIENSEGNFYVYW